MPFIRDYVPDNEDLTEEEQAFLEQTRARIEGGVIRDFVPPEDWEPHVPRSAQEMHDEAAQRASERERRALRDEYAAAKERLRNMSVAEAVTYIRDCPLSVMELYLCAEEMTGKRKGILEAFPPVDPKVREMYGAVAKPSATKE